MRHRLVSTGLLGGFALAMMGAIPRPPLPSNAAVLSAWATFAQGQWQTAQLMRAKASLPRTRRFARATERLYRQAERQIRALAAQTHQPAYISPAGLQAWQTLRSRLRTLDGATSDREYLYATAEADVEIRTRIARMRGDLTQVPLDAFSRRWMSIAAEHLQAAWQMRPLIAGGMAMGLPSRGYLPPNYDFPAAVSQAQPAPRTRATAPPP